MTAKPSKKLLKMALTANAVFSTVTGLACIFASRSLAQLFGIGEPLILTAVGISLLPFAVLVAAVAKRNYPVRWEVYAVCALDFGWVAGVAVLLGFGLYPLSVVGFWATLVVTLFVLDFMILQLVGLRQAGELAV